MIVQSGLLDEFLCDFKAFHFYIRFSTHTWNGITNTIKINATPFKLIFIAGLMFTLAQFLNVLHILSVSPFFSDQTRVNIVIHLMLGGVTFYTLYSAYLDAYNVNSIAQLLSGLINFESYTDKHGLRNGDHVS